MTIVPKYEKNYIVFLQTVLYYGSVFRSVDGDKMLHQM